MLLVSMDGFRWDYLHKVSGLGNFTRLADGGCGVDHVNNAFTTVTFPSHYTMVTGQGRWWGGVWGWGGGWIWGGGGGGGRSI